MARAVECRPAARLPTSRPGSLRVSPRRRSRRWWTAVRSISPSRSRATPASRFSPIAAATPCTCIGTAPRTCSRPRSRSSIPARSAVSDRHSTTAPWLLLRLRGREALRAGRPRGDREEDEGAGVAGPGLRAPAVAAPGGDRLLHEARRAAQGSADPGEDRGPVRGLRLHDQGPRHLRRLLPGPARAVDRTAEGVQAALDVERLLERRRQGHADAARLRHRVLQRQGSAGAPRADRGSEEARPPQGRQGARALHLPPVGAGRGVLAGEGGDALQRARQLHARRALPGRLPGSQDADHLQQGALGNLRPLGSLSREHVPRRSRRTKRRWR